ncbi:unnamed protein product, partial [Ascophyllum nodosum]
CPAPRTGHSGPARTRGTSSPRTPPKNVTRGVSSCDTRHTWMTRIIVIIQGGLQVESGGSRMETRLACRLVWPDGLDKGFY